MSGVGGNVPRFREKVEGSTSFLITCEISPPRGPDTSSFEERIRSVKGKVDGVNITDNPMLSTRMSPVVAAYLALKNGVDPIMQMTCRDRNILGVTSELLGAHAMGIRNILTLWGDMPKGDSPKGVFELDVGKFLHLIAELNRGIDFRGNELNGKCEFFPGAALNPFDTPDRLRQNAEGKISSGAKFFQTQPVFELDSLQEFAKMVEDKKITVLLGVIITISERMIENIKKFAKGMRVPQELEEGLKKYDKKEDKEKVGLEFSAKLVEEIKKHGVFRGAHIYSPAKESLIPKLLDML